MSDEVTIPAQMPSAPGSRPGLTDIPPREGSSDFLSRDEGATSEVKRLRQEIERLRAEVAYLRQLRALQD